MWGYEYGFQYLPYNNVGFFPFVAANFINPESDKHAHPTDLFEESDRYVMRIALPGYQKEQVKIGIKGSELRISAENQAERREEYLVREIPDGKFERTYDLRCIDRDAIEASFDRCILTVTLPKDQSEKCEDSFTKEVGV